MSRFGWVLTAIFVSLMAGIEIVEGHGTHVAMIVSGILSVFGWSRCPGTRPLVRIGCGILGLGLFFALGLIHWCDGIAEPLDWISLGVVVLLAGSIIGGSRWRQRKHPTAFEKKNGAPSP